MPDHTFREMSPITIGEASRLFGLSLRAIRFYEQCGLVEVRRDRRNYRSFDGLARLRLGWISALRAAGLRLGDIREILDVEDCESSGRERALEKLQARRRAVEQDLARLELAASQLQEISSLNSLTGTLAGGDNKLEAYTF